jgi:hypothetical protein
MGQRRVWITIDTITMAAPAFLAVPESEQLLSVYHPPPRAPVAPPPTGKLLTFMMTPQGDRFVRSLPAIITVTSDDATATSSATSSADNVDIANAYNAAFTPRTLAWYLPNFVPSTANGAEFNLAFTIKVIAVTFGIEYDLLFRVCALLADRACVVCGQGKAMAGRWTCTRRDCSHKCPTFEEGYTCFILMGKKFKQFSA